jgi:hypothetical protein
LPTPSPPPRLAWFAKPRTIPRTSEQLAVDLVQLRRAIDLLELCFSPDGAAFAATDEHELTIPPAVTTDRWSSP